MTTYVTFEQGTGYNPRIVRMTTTDAYATVIAAGWLNSAASEGFIFQLTDKFLIAYNTNSTIGVNFFDVTRSNGVYTLSLSSGEVILPVVSGDFAVFSGTSGAIADLSYSPTNAAKTKVVMANAAVVSGNLAKFADTAGTVADQGVAFKSVAGAAAAGGAAAQSFSDAFCTSASCVVGNWNTQANAVSVLKIVPGNGSFVVTSSGDAGVGTFNYVITK